jgi:hypothetical protein
VAAGAKVTPDENGVGLEIALEGYANWTKGFVVGCKFLPAKELIRGLTTNLQGVHSSGITTQRHWNALTHTTHRICISRTELSAMELIDNGTGCFAMSRLTTGKTELPETDLPSLLASSLLNTGNDSADSSSQP